MNKLAVVVVLIAVTTGCSTFRAKQRLDLAPFAENTISLAAEIEYGIIRSSSLVNLNLFDITKKALKTAL